MEDMEDSGNECNPDMKWYYMKRLKATHFFIYTLIPEEILGGEYDQDDADVTWWDFGTLLAKQVDGVWQIWQEDVADTGNIWYQSTYTRDQVYKVRDIHIEWAREGNLLAGEYAGQSVGDACKSVIYFW